MADQSGIELASWIAYEQMDDELQEIRMARAITRAFRLEKTPQANKEEEDEEVIDTTAPDFAEKFQGFINAPGMR